MPRILRFGIINDYINVILRFLASYTISYDPSVLRIRNPTFYHGGILMDASQKGTVENKLFVMWIIWGGSFHALHTFMIIPAAGMFYYGPKREETVALSREY